MGQVTLTESPMVFPFVPLEHSILGKFKISSECSGIIRKEQGRWAVKKSNLHLSAGTGQLTQQAKRVSEGGSRKHAVCNTADSPMLRCVHRLACPKPKLHPPLATACCTVTFAACPWLTSRAEHNQPYPGHLSLAPSLFPGTESVENPIWKHNSLQQETLQDCICSPGYSRQAVIYSKAPDPVLKPCLDDFMGSEAEVSYLTVGVGGAHTNYSLYSALAHMVHSKQKTVLQYVDGVLLHTTKPNQSTKKPWSLSNKESKKHF